MVINRGENESLTGITLYNVKGEIFDLINLDFEVI